MTQAEQARIASIGELAEVCAGYSPRPEQRQKDGKYLLLGGRNIKDGRIRITDKDSRIDEAPVESFRRAVARPGDIIVSTLFDARKLCIYHDSDPPAVINNSCAIIRAPKTNDYILSYLRTRKGEEQFLREAERFTGGTTIPRLSTSALAGIQIPILPLLDLQKLGDSHIEKSSNDELLTLKSELESKDDRIADLERKLSGLLAKDAENEKLRAEVGQLTAYYEDRLQKIEVQRSTNDLKSKIAHGETRQLEFKATLRWNIKANRDDTVMELMVLKTIAAFCNTDGGELLIGVSDSKEILGLAPDHFPDSDKFLLHLRNLIVGKFSACVVQDVHYDVLSIDGREICHVVCKKHKGGVWVKADKGEVFYVRDGPSSTELPASKAVSYIQEHLRE